jgi:hypothetical protein
LKSRESQLKPFAHLPEKLLNLPTNITFLKLLSRHLDLFGKATDQP